ncbi:hypothetical protein BDN70DRAFT_998085 [Pholiota conissans]|uniref:Uncharacterized protein n=1 Tax=Pholiota conissans TaxID=109636 RepID=A0A9P5YMR6_9AGAR|nr:hypothetical protein BDN70DRAFT_998085 [Pholiota conissans]
MSPPLLPSELKDSIIDLVHISDNVDNTRSTTLSALALSCRAFRQRVNHHRFDRIEIPRIEDILPLYSLLLTDSIWENENERLSTHVSVFAVNMMGTLKQYRLFPVLTTGSFELEFILNNIFKAYFNNQAYDRSLSFTWRVEIWKPRTTTIEGLDWPDMSDGLQSAFRQLLQHPRLTQLDIYSLHNVPRDLIRSSFIEELQLTEVYFAEADSTVPQEGILDEWHLRHLTAFVTDPTHSTPLLDYIGRNTYAGKSLPHGIFPQLKTLVCCLLSEEQCETMTTLIQSAKNVMNLSLSIIDTEKLPRLPYHSLVNLESLLLCHLGALRPLAFDYLERVRGIIAPIYPCIPPIQTLEILTGIVSANKYSLDSESLFKGHDFSAIDDYLAEFSPPSLQCIEIHFRVVFTSCTDKFGYDFHKQGTDYVERVLFPKLSSMESLELRVLLTWIAYPDIPEEHYSCHPLHGWNGNTASL